MALETSLPFRQRNSLDVALLHSKLESHHKQLEAARESRERRSACKKGIYIPRSAATQFAATTTPALYAAPIKSKSLEPQRSRSLPAIYHSTNELSATDRKSSSDKTRLDLGISQEKLKQSLLNEIVESPLRSSIEGEAERCEDSREHRPDASAGRQTKCEYPPTKNLPPTHHQTPRPTSVQPGMLEFPSNYRPAEAKAQNTAVSKKQTVSETRNKDAVQRPKYDRPDWAQASQNGDTSLHLSHFWSSANRELPPPPSKIRKQREQHLVADAVKIIQDEQKSKRRLSVIGFLKKR